MQGFPQTKRLSARYKGGVNEQAKNMITRREKRDTSNDIVQY